ncbi:MAG: hypothetical protein COS84_09860 [Armatimonadetes bacterium CG07_land_8_20_14_0_80_40_9]|nr:MAG: hypothetical protein COS84_09860 [Armatimonadetes bacterium CG07_land_8_20_14_0_80_40_9]
MEQSDLKGGIRMGRKTFICGLVLVFLFSLTSGCARKEKKTETKLTKKEEAIREKMEREKGEKIGKQLIIGKGGRIKIVYWTQPFGTSLSENKDIARAWRRLYTTFEKKYPQIEITVEMMPALEAFKTKLLMAAATGNAPDVATVDSYWVPKFYDLGYLQPLGEFWSKEDQKDFFPFCIQGTSKGEKIYALWYGTDLRCLYYRTDLIPQPPKDWEELIKTAKKVTTKKVWGFGFPAGRNEGTLCCLLPYLWGQGGRLVDEKGAPVFNQGKNKKALIFILNAYSDLVNKEKVSPPDVVLSDGESYVEPRVYAGGYAMFNGGSWQINTIRNFSPEVANLWKVTDLPMPKGAKHSTTVGGFTYAIFSKDKEKKSAAWKFIQHISSTSAQVMLNKAGGGLPTRKSAYKADPYFSKDPYYQAFMKMLEYGRPRPGVPLYFNISEQIQLAVGEVVSGGKTAQEALDKASKKIEEEYKRMRKRNQK